MKGTKTASPHISIGTLDGAKAEMLNTSLFSCLGRQLHIMQINLLELLSTSSILCRQLAYW